MKTLLMKTLLILGAGKEQVAAIAAQPRRRAPKLDSA